MITTTKFIGMHKNHIQNVAYIPFYVQFLIKCSSSNLSKSEENKVYNQNKSNLKCIMASLLVRQVQKFQVHVRFLMLLITHSAITASKQNTIFLSN